MATSFLLVNFLDEIRAEGYLKLVEPDTVLCVRPVLDLELSPVLSVGCTLSLRYFFTKASGSNFFVKDILRPSSIELVVLAGDKSP